MKQSYVFLTAFSLLAASFTFAQATLPYVDCKVTQILDNGAFEKNHGFLFNDHPNIRYSVDTTGEQEMLVGTIEFRTADKSNPAEIKYSDFSKLIHVQANWVGKKETYTVAHTGQSGVFAYDGHMVADIDCK